MTYEQASNYLRGEGGSSNDLTDGERRAASALRFLSRRKGFDWWFGDIDEEIQDEIFQELAEALES